MNLRQCEYVLAVAELKNFGLAADKCFITQSTLSTMIGKLEQELGVRIFDRKTKPIAITKEGERVISQLRVIEKEVFNLKQLVQGMTGEMTGELKIGIIPTVAPYLLPEFLDDFTRRFPKMHFTVSELTTETIENMLEKRELDIGIFAIPVENHHLVEIPLYNEPFVLFDCSGSAATEIDSLDHLNYENFWLLEEGHCLHSQVSQICEMQSSEINVNVNFDFKAGSIESLIRFVKVNNGKTLLPYLACLDFGRKDRKRLRHFTSTVPVRTIGLAVHQHFAKKDLLQVLKKDIQEKIKPLIRSGENEVVVSPKVYG